MFAPIYTNLHNSITATNAVKTTFYRWLCGATPDLKILAILDYKLGIKLDIPYVNEFVKTAKQLSDTNELAKIHELLSVSRLGGDDKKLLGDYHKNRIWKNSSLFCDEDFLDAD